MPILLRRGPWRFFFFYSNEGTEPPHLHVERDEGRGRAKFWLLPVSLSDGRTLVVPIDWFPRLARATSEERKHDRLVSGGD